MGIKAFVIAQGIVALIKDANKKGTIIELAEHIDRIADKDLGTSSEKVQQKVVSSVLLPLAKKLMEENPIEFNRILTDELIDLPLPHEKESRERPNYGNFGSKPRL